MIDGDMGVISINGNRIHHSAFISLTLYCYCGLE